MKGKKSSLKKASKSMTKSVSKKASIAKKSAVKNTSKSIKQTSAKKTSATAKKSPLKKAAIPAKKAAAKKISTAATKRSAKKSSSTAQKRLSKKASTSSKKNQTTDLNELFDVAFWLESFQTNMALYLDLSDENPFKYDLVDEMEDCLIQALTLDPNHVPTLILFAAFRLDFEEKLGEAMKALQKADKLSPGNKKVQTLMQRCEKMMNEASEAKKNAAKKRSAK